MPQPTPALLMAGIPQLNSALYHRIRFLVGDPVAYVQLPTAAGRRSQSSYSATLRWSGPAVIARADEVACPAISRRPAALSGDRETATAQAAANASAARA